MPPAALLVPELLGLIFDACNVRTLDVCSNVCTFWESCAVASLKRRRSFTFVAAAHAYLRARASRAVLSYSAAVLNRAANIAVRRAYGVLYMTDSKTLRRFKIQPGGDNSTSEMLLSLCGKRSSRRDTWTGVLDYIKNAYAPAARRQWLLTLLVDTLKSEPCTERFVLFHWHAAREGFTMAQRATYLAARAFCKSDDDVMVYRPFYMPRFFLSAGNPEEVNLRMDAIMENIPGPTLVPMMKFLPMIEWTHTLRRQVYYPFLIWTPNTRLDVGVVQRSENDSPPRLVDIRTRDQFAFEFHFPNRSNSTITRTAYREKILKRIRN